MSDRHLPTLPEQAPPPAEAGSEGAVVGPAGPGGGEDARDGGGESSGAGTDGSGTRTVLVGGVLLAGGLILSLGVASLVGDGVRRAVLVEVDRSPAASRPSYTDAPAEAAAFFARRDTVRVRVPGDMTVGDFLSLYHLETNAAARAALRDQLGAVADEDLLREGDAVTLTITIPRVER